MQKQYSSAQQQITETGTSIVRKLEEREFLPAQIRHNLMAGGLSHSDVAVVAAACISTGVDPRLLKYPTNVPPVIRMMDMMRHHGYIPGEDFYVAVYKSNVALPDETGAPSDQKTRVPTVVVMPSAARAVSNMKEDGRLYGKTYHLSTKEITGEEAKKVFAQDMPSHEFVEGKTRVVKATLKTFMAGVGALDAPGEEPVFYGFFSPYKKGRNGKPEEDWLETGKVKDNYSPVDIATKRAQTKAARYVTRTNYSRDNRPVDVRMAALVDSANNRLSALESNGGLEEAFDDGIGIVDAEPEPPKQLTALPANNQVVTDDGFIVVEEEAPRPQPKAKKAAPKVEEKPVVQVEVTGPEDLDHLFDTEVAQVEEVDFDAGVKETPQELFAKAIDFLREDLSEENAKLLDDLRQTGAKGAVSSAGYAIVYEVLRGEDYGNWLPEEMYAGMAKAELLLRFIVGAGYDENLDLFAVPGFQKLFLKGAKTKQGWKDNPGWSESFAAAVWAICDSFNAFLKIIEEAK